MEKRIGPGIALAAITPLLVLFTFAGAMNAVAVKDEKVTICHRTNATKNPYVKITVSKNSVDGDKGNNKGRGDHYAEHTGPVWDKSQPNGGDWGDIIPPISGVHEGRNWTVEGQAIYRNGCKPVAKATPSVTPTPTPTVPTKKTVEPPTKKKEETPEIRLAETGADLNRALVGLGLLLIGAGVALHYLRRTAR